MLKNTTFSTLIFLTSLCLLVQDGYTQVWVTKASFPGHERDDGITFTVGNRAYCGTGLSSWFAPLGDFYSFDFTSEQWSLEGPLPSGKERQYATGFSDNLYGYVFGGINGNTYLNDLWRYETGAQSWQQMSSLPDSGRSGAAGFFLNGQLFVVGGKTESHSAINEVWSYDIASDTWTQKNNMSYSIWRGSACATDSLGYLSFGVDENGKYKSELLVYYPDTDQWSLLSPYPEEGLTHSTFINMGQFLLSFGGRDSNDLYANNLYRYNIISDNWNKLSAMPAAHRKGGVAFSHQSTFYYTTGITALASRLRQTWACTNVFIGNKEYMPSKLNVFPNPASSELTLDFPPDIKQVTIEFYDDSGKLKKKKSVTTQVRNIDVQDLPEGVYHLIIKSSEYKQHEQIIKLP